MDTTTLLIVILVLLFVVWRRLVWPRTLVLINSFSSNEKPNVLCRLACAYHRVHRCGRDKCPTGGINVSRAARHLGAVVRWKIQFLTDAERSGAISRAASQSCGYSLSNKSDLTRIQPPLV